MMLVGACSSSTTSPTPAASAAATRRRAERSGFGRGERVWRRRAERSRIGGTGPGRADGPDRLRRAGQGTAKRRRQAPFNGKTVSIQTQWIGGEGTNFAASVADFAKATGIKIQIDSIGSSHETVLKTRIEGGKPPDLAMLAQPTPILAYAKQGKVIDVATFMDRRQARQGAPGDHRPGHRGRPRSGASRTRPT